MPTLWCLLYHDNFPFDEIYELFQAAWGWQETTRMWCSPEGQECGQDSQFAPCGTCREFGYGSCNGLVCDGYHLRTHASVGSPEQWRTQAESMVSSRALAHFGSTALSQSPSTSLLPNLAECCFLRNRMGLELSFLEDPLLMGMMACRTAKGMSSRISLSPTARALSSSLRKPRLNLSSRVWQWLEHQLVLMMQFLPTCRVLEVNQGLPGWHLRAKGARFKVLSPSTTSI